MHLGQRGLKSSLAHNAIIGEILTQPKSTQTLNQLSSTVVEGDDFGFFFFYHQSFVHLAVAESFMNSSVYQIQMWGHLSS